MFERNPSPYHETLVQSEAPFLRKEEAPETIEDEQG